MSRSSLRRRTAAVALTVPLLVLAACSSDAEEPADGGDASEDAGAGDGGGEESEAPAEPISLQIASTSPTQPQWVATKYGVEKFGPELGLDMTVEENFNTFDSHSIATQTVLSGGADVVAGSFVSTMVLVEQGQDFQVFCPYISQDGLVIAGANGVDSIDDLFADGTRVAIDSPGGAAMVAFDAILQAVGEERTSADIVGQQILESSGLRATAFAAGEVDATIIHQRQFNEAATQVEDAVILAQLFAEVPEFIKEGQAAPKAWLEENAEEAATYCAAVLLGMRELKTDYDLFKQAVADYAETDAVAEEELERVFGWVNEYDFWPEEDGGFSPEAVEFMAQVAITAGLLQDVPAYEDVVNADILARAVEIANEHSS